MKRRLLVGAAILLLSAAAPHSGIAANGPTYQVNLHGDHGFAYGCSVPCGQPGTVQTYVFVSQSKDGNQESAYLQYWVREFLSGPPDSRYLESGRGSIPVQDLRGDGKGSLMLSTDTRTIPGFQHIYGLGGVIDVRWQNDPDGYWQTNTGRTMRRYPGGFMYLTNGTSTRRDAAAQGTIVGWPVLTNFGCYTGTNHNVTLQIYTGSS